MGHDVDFIFPVDINKIPKMDALFIRARTDPMNVTYVAARMAAVPRDPGDRRPGLDPDLLGQDQHVFPPDEKERRDPEDGLPLKERSHRSNGSTRLFDELGTPLIVKEPSTSFSLRVEKVNDIAGFFQVARRFIHLSDWIVVQQYIESKYDWRVGVLDGELLYACKYTIPSVTFKIQASVNGHIVYCGVESVPENAIPPHVVRLGIDAGNAVGNGLYGVDIKNNNGDAYVIEVNDNPSLESGEDGNYPDVYEKIVTCLFTQ